MPRTKLTTRTIDSLKPSDKEIEYWDVDQPGLLLKITPTGKKVFMFAYRTKDGTKRKPRIGVYGAITLDTARRTAKNWDAEITKGGDPSGQRQDDRKGLTVKDLGDRYLRDIAEARNKPSYRKELRRLLDKKIVPAIGSKKIRSISPADIAELHSKLSATPYEANRVLAALRVMFKQAEAWGLRDKDSPNPCRLVKKYAERRRDWDFTEGEIGAIFAALELFETELKAANTESPNPFSALRAIRLLFSTACRAGEIRNLRFDAIRPETREIVLADSKTGRVVKPLTPDTETIIDSAPNKVGQKYVCADAAGEPISMNVLSKLWAKLLESAGVSHRGLHAIRHYSATQIANDPTIPMHVAMRLTGHKTPAMFMRYVHTQHKEAVTHAETFSKAHAERIEKAKAEAKAKLVRLNTKSA